MPAFSTVATVLTDVRDVLDDADSTQWADAELIRHLNWAIRQTHREIARNWKYFILRTTHASYATDSIVDGTQNYDLPTGFWEMIEVVANADTYDNPRLDLIDLQVTIDDDEAEGYRIYNDDVYLYPTPDESVTDGLEFWYFKEPTKHTATSDSLDIAELGDIYVQLTAVRAKMARDEDLQSAVSIYRVVSDVVRGHVLQINKPREAQLTMFKPDAI
jgi:hypothetical protein